MSIYDPKRQYDGFVSVEAGVDSGKSPSILKPNQLAWAVNTTVRGGFVTCRPGFKKHTLSFNTGTQTNFETGRFQGAGTYTALNGKPYLVASISGRLFAINLTQGNKVTDISISGDLNNPNQSKAYFQQAEYWLVVQDTESKPILWNGAVSRRSAGFTGTSTGNEVPVGGPMAYGKGRLWVAQGREYVGGDLVWSDDTLGAGSVINFNENTFIAEGGAFAVPANDGASITGMAFAGNLDTSLGEGDLLVFTNRDVFAFDAPVDRTTWKDLTYPIQRFALLDYGSFSHTSIVRVNGDLFFRSQNGVLSLAYARRDFTSRWGNTPISSEVDRALRHDTQRFLYACSGVNFDNRMLMTVEPHFTKHGVYHRGLVVMDFDLISGMADKLPPAWEGVWSGVQFLQLLTIRVNGAEKCYAFVLSPDSTIELWEITTNSAFDNQSETDIPIDWAIETRNFGFKTAFEGKKLEGMDTWWDQLMGDFSCLAKYRADNVECWNDWATWGDCAAYKECADGVTCQVVKSFRAQSRNRITLPPPPDSMDTLNGNLARFGGEFQVRLEVSGRARLRKIRAYALVDSETLYGVSKVTTCTPAATTDCQSDSACKELVCCPEDDYSYVLGCSSIAINDSRAALPDATIGYDYSEGISQTGSSPKHYSISSGSLPAGLSILESDGTIYGNPDPGTDGDYEFTIFGYNDCGTTSKSFTLTVNPAPELGDFIWGFEFSYTFPSGPAMYLPDASDQTPSGVSMVGNVLSGIPSYASATLGPTHIAYQGYEVDGITPVGPLVEFDVHTYFKVYAGEWNGALPAEFSKTDITSTLTNNGTAGPRETLVSTARGMQLDFPATSSSKYRVIAIPGPIFDLLYASAAATGKQLNRVRYSDDTYPTTINGSEGYNPGDELHGYNGYPFSPGDLYMGDADSIPYFTIVIDTTASAFTVYGRYLSSSSQTVQQLNTNNGWIKNGSINKFDTTTGTLLSVTAAVSSSWAGSSWVQNTSASPAAVTRSVTTDFTYNVDSGSLIILDQTVKSIGAVGLAAYGGVPDYLGASSDQSAPATIGGSNPSSTYTSGANFTLFQGSGTLSVSVTTVKQFAQSGLTSYNHTERDYLSALTDKSSGGIQFTYSYYLN